MHLYAHCSVFQSLVLKEYSTTHKSMFIKCPKYCWYTYTNQSITKLKKAFIWKHSNHHKDIIIIWSNNIYKHYAWLVWCIPHFVRYTNFKLFASLSTDLPISSAVLYSRFSPRLMSITFTPRLASSLAYAFPIPSLLPVTTGKWLNTLHLQWLI